jgi:membrane-associated protease RseP (regulator of RpoE activity)
VKEMFGTGHALPPQMFEGFYAAMCIWDDGMAESAVRFLQSPEGAGRRMVVLVGAGHVRMRFGIPDRVERRTGWPQLVVVPLELAPGETGRDGEAAVAGHEGDYLYVTPPSPRLAPARLGVGVETENPPAEGIAITQVSPGGPAAAAGVRVGDVLLRLDGKPLSDVTSLRLVLDRLPRGRSVRLVLRREEETVTTAVLLPRMPPHPPVRP